MLTGPAGAPATDLGAGARASPVSPSSLVELWTNRARHPALSRAGTDAAAEVRRCRAQRPRGDPLAAALEAGETPSPDMVAAAGEEGRLRPRVAWSLLGGVLAALAVLCLIAPRYYLVNYVPLPKRPAVLEDRAAAIVQTLGS
jgi:hypothetical protein